MCLTLYIGSDPALPAAHPHAQVGEVELKRARHVVHAELVGAGHMAPVTEPDRVNRLVLDHINAVEATWHQAA